MASSRRPSTRSSSGTNSAARSSMSAMRSSAFKVGDRVGVDPTLNCGECYFCQRGKGNLCERWNAVGVGHHPGGFAECVAVPERAVYPLPEGMSFQSAALIEPVSCVVHGFHLLNPQPGRQLPDLRRGTDGSAERAGRPLLRRERGRDHRHQPEPAGGRPLVRLRDARRRRSTTSNHAAPRGFDIVIEATGKTKVAEIAHQRGHPAAANCSSSASARRARRRPTTPFKIYNEEMTIIGSMAVLRQLRPGDRYPARGRGRHREDGHAHLPDRPVRRGRRAGTQGRRPESADRPVRVGERSCSVAWQCDLARLTPLPRA